MSDFAYPLHEECGVFGISLGHGQADIGPFHSTSLLFILALPAAPEGKILLPV